MKRLVVVSGIAAMALVTLSFLAGPDPGFTGAPDEQNCTNSGCHTSFKLNPDSDGQLSVTGVPEVYTPGMQYSLTLSLMHPTAKTWGFQITAVDSKGDPIGKFVITDQKNTQIVEGGGPRENRSYVEHTEAGNAANKTGGNSWTFAWVAPDSNVGNASFYACANAANGDEKPIGDRIYTKSPSPVAVAKAP